MLQHWTSSITHVPNARVAQEHTPDAALTTELLLQGEPTLGAGKAPLTIVEFSDFECPYCRQFHEQVIPSLKREYIETGLVRFIHKDLPLPFHSQAKHAAAAARCAGEQNRYWDLYEVLFDQQTSGAGHRKNRRRTKSRRLRFRHAFVKTRNSSMQIFEAEPQHQPHLIYCYPRRWETPWRHHQRGRFGPSKPVDQQLAAQKNH